MDGERLNAYLAARGILRDETKTAIRADITKWLRTAKQSNKAYLDIDSPTAAQRNAQVEALTKQVNRLIRLALNDMTGDE
jgi:hypothetical protein